MINKYDLLDFLKDQVVSYSIDDISSDRIKEILHILGYTDKDIEELLCQ